MGWSLQKPSFHQFHKFMKLFAVVIPTGGVFFFDVAHGPFDVVVPIELINGAAEQFEVTVKEHFGEHEFLVDGEAVFDLPDLLKIIDDRRAGLLLDGFVQ